jgi:hypothetical protein
VVSRELRTRIQTEGLVSADGTLNPCIEAHRRSKRTELEFADDVRSDHQSEKWPG